MDENELRWAAIQAGLAYARGIESNVVQDKIVRGAVRAALKVVMPHVDMRPRRTTWLGRLADRWERRDG